MTAWPADILAEIDREELVVVLHRDGYPVKRVPIWVVTVDGDVYVRSYKGVTSMWFRRVQNDFDQELGLATGDVAVTFENVHRSDPINDAINAAISAAFTSKYARYDYVDAMSQPAAVEATLRIVPRAH